MNLQNHTKYKVQTDWSWKTYFVFLNGSDHSSGYILCLVVEIIKVEMLTRDPEIEGTKDVSTLKYNFNPE